MITLYQFEVSPFCDKIRRVLNVKRAPYQVRDVSILSSTTGYRKLNPIGKVPCIEHQGRYIADSTEIAHYLEAQFPEPRLIPQAPAERALCHFLEDWADESLYFFEVRLRFTVPHNASEWARKVLAHDSAPMRALAPPLVVRTMTATAKAQGVGRRPLEMVLKEIERHVAAAGDWLGDRAYLVGDALSLADISVFAQMFAIQSTPEGRSIIAASKAVSAWMERVARDTSAPSL